MATVYVETSFFSQCATVRTGAIEIGRRATSLNWWQTQSHAFELFVSDEVIRELSDPVFPDAVRVPAMEMLRGLNILELDEHVAALADVLVREKVMPEPAIQGDAVHFAASVVHGMDYTDCD